MVVEATDVPAMQSGWPLNPSWSYSYVSCVGEDPLSEQSVVFVELGFLGGGDGDGDGDGDPGDGDGDGDPGDGDGDGNSGGDGGSGTDGGTDFGETGDDFGSTPRDGQDGCNCRSAGPITPMSTFALLGLFGLVRRRSRT